MSAFPEDMLLWPDGQARVLNVDNRWDGTINGIACRVELKGDFATVSYVNAAGEQERMYQPHFNVLGVILGALQVQQEHKGLPPEVIGIVAKRLRDG